MQLAIEHIRKNLAAQYPESEISGFVRIIVEHILKTDYRVALLHKYVLTPPQMLWVEQIVNRLKTHEPIQYILGETEFYGLPFWVDASTLIPRPETEELVEFILSENKKDGLSFLDIGTGSGCIAIALVCNLNKCYAQAWDFSMNALEMAKKNAVRNAAQIDFMQIDVLGNYPTNKKFDFIVSNPPYVLECEKTAMDANVLDFEPHSALFVPNNSALLFYERIADIALELLNDGGKLYFEINQAKGPETIDMLKNKGFNNLELIKDLSRRNRIVKADLKQRVL